MGEVLVSRHAFRFSQEINREKKSIGNKTYERNSVIITIS